MAARLFLVLALVVGLASAATVISKTKNFCKGETGENFWDYVNEGKTEKICGCACEGPGCMKCRFPTISGTPPNCYQCPPGTNMPTKTVEFAEADCTMPSQQYEMQIPLETPLGFDCHKEMKANVEKETIEERKYFVVCNKECEGDLPCPVENAEGKPCGEIQVPPEVSVLGLEGAITKSVSYTRTVNLDCPDKPSIKYIGLFEVDGKFICKYKTEGKATFVPRIPDTALCTAPGFKFIPTLGRCQAEEECPKPEVEPVGDLMCGPITKPYIDKLNRGMVSPYVADRIRDYDGVFFRQCAYSCASAVFRWEECRSLGGLGQGASVTEAYNNIVREFQSATDKKVRSKLLGRIIACSRDLWGALDFFQIDGVTIRNKIEEEIMASLHKLTYLTHMDYTERNVPLGFSTKIQSVLLDSMLSDKKDFVTLVSSPNFAAYFGETNSKFSDGPGRSCRHWARMSLIRASARLRKALHLHPDDDTRFQSLFESCLEGCDIDHMRHNPTDKLKK